MKFSVIIPNLNTPVIDKTINSLIAQSLTTDLFEIIVVGRDDIHALSPNPRVHFDETERPYSPAEARNRGAQQARGDFLVFLDADCIAPPDWLKTLDQFLATRQFDVIGGSICTATNNYWTLADNLSMFHEFMVWQPAGQKSSFPSLNLAIRRSAFEAIGGFDQTYPVPAGEDADLTERLTKAGHVGWFEPTFWILHAPPRNSFRHLLKHGFMQGKYSPKIRRPDSPGSFPDWLRQPWALRLLSPLLAMGVALKIFIQPKYWKFIYTLPAIFASKIAWCFGAASKPDWREASISLKTA